MFLFFLLPIVVITVIFTAAVNHLDHRPPPPPPHHHHHHRRSIGASIIVALPRRIFRSHIDPLVIRMQPPPSGNSRMMSKLANLCSKATFYF